MLLFVSTISAQSNATTLLILGDSLSAGYQMSASKAWPALLEIRLAAPKVINASSSGETSRGGLRRLPSLLAKHHPDWCLLELGGNDALQGQPVSRVKQNLGAMIDQAQRSECQVILAEIKIPNNYGRRYSESFTAIYHELAEEYQTPLLPFFVEPIYATPGMMLADGIHPTEQAQPLIAEAIAQFVTPLLID
jgi:acyl-CoA thioesterase-1